MLVMLDERRHDPVRPGELAHELGWEKSRLSHHLTRMEARRLVERRPCPGDQRGHYVGITRLGRRVLEAAAPAHVAAVRAAFVDRLTPAQLRSIARAADIVIGGLEEIG